MSTITAVAFGPDVSSRAKPLRKSPLDREHLARYSCGNRALEAEVLELFAEHAPIYLGELRSAMTEKAWRQAAHTLKGSARAVGALRVADRAEWAEALLDNADPMVRARSLAGLEEAVEEARSHIAKLLKA